MWLQAAIQCLHIRPLKDIRSIKGIFFSPLKVRGTAGDIFRFISFFFNSVFHSRLNLTLGNKGLIMREKSAMTWHLSAASSASTFSISIFGKNGRSFRTFFLWKCRRTIRQISEFITSWTPVAPFVKPNLQVSVSFAFVMKVAPGHVLASKAPSDTWCRERQAVKCTGLYSSAAFSPWTQTPSKLASWAWHQCIHHIDVINSVCSAYWFLHYGRFVLWVRNAFTAIEVIVREGYIFICF